MHWIIFFGLVIGLIILDFIGDPANRKRALFMVTFYISLALTFTGYIYYQYDLVAATEYVAAYAVELTLSLDNVFVFLIIFRFFHIPPQGQKVVLTVGIISAIILRGFFIWGGVWLMQTLHWINYVFGFILLWGAWKMLSTHPNDYKKSGKKFIKFVSRYNRFHPYIEENKFFLRKNNKLHMTPLLLALAMIEFIDILFAIDSVPAVLSLTTNTFVIYTSNIFAIMGLRSLYSVLAMAVQKFTYLSYSLAIILLFVALKTLLAHFLTIPIWISLLVIFLTLLGGILFSYHKSSSTPKSASFK